MLSLEPDGLDLGAVKACETLQRQAVDLSGKGSGKNTTRTEIQWKPRWWFLTNFLFFTPIPGEDESNLTCAYFSDGLVQPPTRNCPI